MRRCMQRTMYPPKESSSQPLREKDASARASRRPPRGAAGKTAAAGSTRSATLIDDDDKKEKKEPTTAGKSADAYASLLLLEYMAGLCEADLGPRLQVRSSLSLPFFGAMCVFCRCAKRKAEVHVVRSQMGPLVLSTFKACLYCSARASSISSWL